MGMKKISKERLAQLLRAEYKLSCLEDSGVALWGLYDVSLNKELRGNISYNNYNKLSDDKITNEYEDI